MEQNEKAGRCSPKLLNGELTHMTLVKLHTRENSGIVVLLLRGVAFSIIQPSSIIHN